MQAGFDMDLYLDWRRDGHPNGYNLLLRNTDTPMEHEGDSSYFNADSGASIASFLTEYLPDELSSDADVLLSSQRAITTNTNTSSLVQLTECIAIVVNMSYGRGRTARTLVCQVAGTSTQSGPRTAMQTTSSTRFASKESS